MAVFVYKAFDQRQLPVTGTLGADSLRQARDLLRDRGLIVQRVMESKAARPRPWARLRRRDRHHVAAFIRELSTLLSVGVPLTESLDTLIRQYDGGFRATLLVLRDRVAGGMSLAEAMQQSPHTFDELCVSITRVGEDSGTLEMALERLAEFKERSQQLKGKLTTALIYPAIVMTMAVAISVFLMTFVVPNILVPLVDQGKPLPLPTRLVKGTSDFLLTRWWLLLLIGTASSAAISAALRTKRGRRWWHRQVLRLPLIGKLARMQAIVRMAIVLSTLLKSGVVFLTALEVARRTTRNVVLQEALERCEAAIVAGGEIAAAMEDSGAFTPLVVQVFAVGQQSGRLEEMLDRLAADYDQQVATAAQRLTAVLEPLLIIIMALVVLCIVLATMLPILEASSVLS